MSDVDITLVDALAEDLVAQHRELLRALVDQRKSHGLTQEMVAERMGVSQPTVAAFERYDANPTLSTIRRYALAIGAGIKHYVEDQCCDIDTQFNVIARRLRPEIQGSQLEWRPAATPAEWLSSATRGTKVDG